MNQAQADSRILAKAREASRKIKALTDAHHVQIKAIYQDFRTQANAIIAEASADELQTPSADSLPTTAVNERKEQNPSCHNSPN
jgi:hypothetical protein